MSIKTFINTTYWP